MELEGSLTCSQGPATCHYPEHDQPMRVVRLPPRSRWELQFCGLLRSEECTLEIGPIGCPETLHDSHRRAHLSSDQCSPHTPIISVWTIWILSYALCLDVSKWSLSVFSTKTLCALFSINVICPNHLIILDLFTWMPGESWKSWRSSLQNFSQSLIISTLFAQITSSEPYIQTPLTSVLLLMWKAKFHRKN